MLLRQLVEYAERLEREQPEKVLPQRYQKVGIRWIITLNRKGRSSGKPLRTSSGLEGREEGPKRFMAPGLVRSSGVRAKLLADNGEYVLGLAGEGADLKRIAERHKAFKDAVRACAEETGLPAVIAVARFLEALNVGSLALPDGVDSRDIFTFSVDGVMPIDLPAVRSYWAKHAGDTPISKQGKETFEAECLISGEYGPVMDREPVKIKGIPGGQSSGTNMISANQRAFESYGLSVSHVAPVKLEYAEKYANALNDLLRNDHTHLRVGPVVYVFWTKDAPPLPIVESLSKPETENPLLAALFAGKAVELKASDRPEQVKKSLVSPWAGREFESIRDNAFYAISLSANGGRAVVRDQLTSTVKDVRDKLRAYFNAQRMVDNAGQSENPLGIYTLAAGLYRDANKEMAPGVPVSLLSFALRGKPLPFLFLQQLVRRNCIERRVTRPRAVLTKMVLLSSGKEMSGMEKLRTTRPETAYHLGRLLAVFEGIQKKAQPGINTTLVDRFYGSASTTPALVFGRLISGIQNNLAKLRKSNPGLCTILEKELQEITASIERFPKVLKVEEQALFGLGYFHEQASQREKIKARSKRT
jgi:CRISPR-associated protein Csd1